MVDTKLKAVIRFILSIIRVILFAILKAVSFVLIVVFWFIIFPFRLVFFAVSLLIRPIMMFFYWVYNNNEGFNDSKKFIEEVFIWVLTNKDCYDYDTWDL